MKKILAILMILVAAAALNGCEENDLSVYQSNLQDLVAQEWAKYSAGKENWGGGIALRILSPKGDFFVSTGMGDNVTENIHFRGASTTKTFAAASIMLLQQRGLLDIDDKITDLIPGSTEAYCTYDIPYKDQISIRQLLQHRAGVFDISNNDIPATASAPYAGKNYIEYVEEDLGQPDHTFTIDEQVGVVADNGLYFTPPGTKFHYSDTGYSILGKIIERVSGQRFDLFVKDNFITPNGLAQTTFPRLGADQTLPAPFAKGYLWYQKKSTLTTLENPSPHVAEGNVVSTPADLAKWAKLLINGKSGLEKKYVRMMMEYLPTGEHHKYYGLGCNYTPGLGYGHNGGCVGYMTVMRHDPQQNVTILMFASVLNADDLVGQGDFMYDLGYAAKELLGYSTAEAGGR
ncbi:MAG: serine hydrolase domain-containing protein [Candidatus Margulisiibacteriota bacterium]